MDPFYRVGGKQPRNIYRVSDEHPEGEYVGVLFNEEDAKMIVRIMNRNWHLSRGNDGPDAV